MTVSVIVAISENGVIGHQGGMPWHLSDDLRRFKRLTMGHHIVMGRKTFESIGRLLPGRTTVIITRNSSFSIDGALVASGLDEALKFAHNDGEVFVVGGGEIYELAVPQAHRLYVTRVHTEVDGDVHFPAIDWNAWTLISRQTKVRDEQNDFDYTLEIYERKN